MQNFRNLNVWKKSHALALSIHRLSRVGNELSEVRKMLIGLIQSLKSQAES